jgi:hypothetical protein
MASAAFLAARERHLLAIGRPDLLELPPKRELRYDEPEEQLRGPRYLDYLAAREREAS